MGLDNGNGEVMGVETVQIEGTKDQSGKWKMKEKAGSKKTWGVDLVLLAMGYLGPETPISEELGLTLDRRGNFQAAFGKYRTNVDGVWACGDCRRGQSLVVWGIAEGRQCAREIDLDLMGDTKLP